MSRNLLEKIKKPESKLGMILVLIYFLVALCLFIDAIICKGFFCWMLFSIIGFPWASLEFLTFLHSSFLEVLGGILINTIILYYLGYFLQNLFNKNKLPKNKLVYFFSVIVTLFNVFSVYVYTISRCRGQYMNYDLIIIAFAILSAVFLLCIFLFLYLRKKNSSWFLLLNFVLIFILLVPSREHYCGEIKVSQNISECKIEAGLVSGGLNNCRRSFVMTQLDLRKDINVCRENEYYKIECYMAFFEKNDNSEKDEKLQMCNILTEEDKNICSRALAYVINDFLLCDNIKNDKFTRRGCIMNILHQINNPSLCYTINGWIEDEMKECEINIRGND